MILTFTLKIDENTEYAIERAGDGDIRGDRGRFDR
jgi:hypothetical protein